MSRWIWGLGVSCLLLLMMMSLPITAADNDPADSLSDVQDILFLTPRRPFLMRLHLRVKGKPFRESRRDWADAQFRLYDTDQNGVIEGDELRRFPTQEMLRTGMTQASAGKLQADSAPMDGKISPEESRRFLMAAFGTPFRLVNQPNSGILSFAGDGSGVQVNLFPKLDVDRDGKLSAAEIQSAPARLRRYDRNEDDVVDVLELQQGLPEEQAAAQQRLSGVLALLLIVDPSDPGHAVSRGLLQAYDKVSRDPKTKTFRKDERLSAAELPIDKAEFAGADRNRDGKLDRAELAQLSVLMSPTIELLIEAPTEAGEYRLQPLKNDSEPGARLIGLEEEASGLLKLTLNETVLALTADSANPDAEQRLRETYIQQFRNLDQNQNEYLEPPEMQRFGFPESFFTRADLDRDGKLFLEEYKAHIDRDLELSKTSFSLEITGDGRSLFQLFDTQPADGRLSLRELSEASAKLTQGDTNRDGNITSAELAISLNAVFQTGVPRLDGPFAIPREARMANPAAAAANAGSAHPAWFLKMDRNGDGDLSPKEFLGRRALFDKIDSDRDGLISAAEALAVHQSALAEPRP